MSMPRLNPAVPRFPPVLAGLASLGLVSCAINAPSYDDVLAADEANRAQTTDTTSSTGPASTGTLVESTGEELPTASSTTAASSLDLGSSSGTTAEPVEPDPSIVDVEFEPKVIDKAGEITVSVQASDAEGVRMQVLDGQAVELVLGAKGKFTGKISVLTGLLNGKHEATFTPWRGTLEGAPEEREFAVGLPPPGTPSAWDASGDLGEGMVAAVAVTTAGELFEFGTLDASSQCYLRRRTLQAALIDPKPHIVLPDYPCKAIGMHAAPDGRLYLLLEREVMGTPLWWLGRVEHWGAEAIQLKTGAIGQKAHALAMRADGSEVAVCATAPATKDDVDMRVSVYREQNAQIEAPKDYAPKGDKIHKYSETPRDCAYRGERLVLVGEVYGPHDDGQVMRHRLFSAEFHTVSTNVLWTVADESEGTQSGLTGLSLTSMGEIVGVGFSCGDDCDPQPRLWIFDLDGGIKFKANLDAAMLTPADVVWSPAGYAIVASTKLTGPWQSTFVLQGWKPGMYEPAWSFEHADLPTLHFAWTVALAPNGSAPWAIFAGGRGSDNVPAVATVSP